MLPSSPLGQCWQNSVRIVWLTIELRICRGIQQLLLLFIRDHGNVSGKLTCRTLGSKWFGGTTRRMLYLHINLAPIRRNVANLWSQIFLWTILSPAWFSVAPLISSTNTHKHRHTPQITSQCHKLSQD